MNVIPQDKQPPELKRDEYVQTVTVKGQVTIPVELRKMLGVQPNSQVLVSLEAGKVVIKPVSMTLEEAFGSVQPINVPESFKELREIALEEHIEGVLNRMRTE
jgi:AbrB family looped-hinge helix DNA binding protein